jgi:hypothetical protein
MTDTQPEALRFADSLEHRVPSIKCLELAATEIRRLHDENDTLKKCLFQMQNAAIELVKPEQEPVAWVDKNGIPSTYKSKLYTIPLYTAPPKRKWVGLTWDDMPEEYAGDRSFLDGAKWAEAKLKGKNDG